MLTAIILLRFGPYPEFISALRVPLREASPEGVSAWQCHCQRTATAGIVRIIRGCSSIELPFKEYYMHNNLFISQILLTITTALITGAPLLADLNRTHATNPMWTGHARYHVVWQVVSYGLLGFLNLYLIWMADSDLKSRLSISCAILFAIIIAFYITAFSVKLFGGAFYDTNGYLPFGKIRIFGREIELDVNAVGFTLFAVVLVIATISICTAS